MNHIIKIKILFLFVSYIFGNDINNRFSIAGDNRSEIIKALDNIHEDKHKGMEWLIKHMPEDHLKEVSAEFLISNCNLAYKVKNDNPWDIKIPDEIFYAYVLPYSNLNERIDDWRKDFYFRFYPVVEYSDSPYSATALLNQKIYDMLGVVYSTKRPKADQSPYESILAGMASCTGLSILLIDACRSVGIPARFVGTPSWYNNSGNHSWVEIWDGRWHFTGAAEPTGNKLNETWFHELASKATKNSMKYGIFAATWEETNLYFPMDWLPNEKKYYAIDVTDNYRLDISSKDLIPIRVRALDSKGNRRKAKIMVVSDGKDTMEGLTKDESCDANDHLTFMLERGRTFIFKSGTVFKSIKVSDEELIDFNL